MEKDWEWCSKHAKAMGMEVGRELYNASGEICQLAVQGPLAMKAVQKFVTLLLKICNTTHLKSKHCRNKRCHPINNRVYRSWRLIYVANEDGQNHGKPY